MTSTRQPDPASDPVVAGRVVPPKAEVRSLTVLRGIVALWVVGHHCVQQTPTAFKPPAPFANVPEVGYVGVDIFFLLSGFVLAYANRDMKLGHVPGFFLRRAVRVYPLNIALIGVLSIGAVAGIYLGAPVGWSRLLAALLMVQPFLTRQPEWLVVNWSVGIEFACYLACPFALISARMLGAGYARVLLMSAVLLEWHFYPTYVTYWWATAALARCVPAFFLGVLSYLEIARWQDRLFQVPAVLRRVVELVLIAELVWQASQGQTRPIPFVAMLIILVLYIGNVPTRPTRSIDPLAWLGRISFLVYLLHLPVVTLLSGSLPLLERHLPVLAVYPAYLGCVLLPVLGLSQLSYTFIETPGRRLFRRARHPADRGLRRHGYSRNSPANT